MNQYQTKAKIGLMTASVPLMSYLACSSVIASIANAYPDAPLQLVQMLTYVSNLTSILSSIVVSLLTPYISKKTLITVSGFLFPISGMIIFLYHPNVLFILIMTLFMGIASGVRVTCIPTLICDCFEGKTAARLMGMQGAFISCGSMIFAWLGSQLGKVHWERAYLSFLFVLIALVIEFICLPKGKLDQKREKASTASGKIIPLSILFYTLITLLHGTFIAVFNSDISLLMQVRQIGGTVQAGYATTLYSFAGIIAGIVTGYVITKLRQRVFFLAVGFGFAGMFISTLGHSVALLCLGGICCGIAFSIMAPSGNYYASNDSSEYNRSLCIALFNSGNGCGLLISSVVFGAIFGNLPLEQQIPQTFRAAAIGYAALFFLTLLIIFGVLKIRFGTTKEN